MPKEAKEDVGFNETRVIENWDVSCVFSILLASAFIRRTIFPSTSTSLAFLKIKYHEELCKHLSFSKLREVIFYLILWELCIWVTMAVKVGAPYSKLCPSVFDLCELNITFYAYSHTRLHLKPWYSLSNLCGLVDHVMWQRTTYWLLLCHYVRKSMVQKLKKPWGKLSFSLDGVGMPFSFEFSQKQVSCSSTFHSGFWKNNMKCLSISCMSLVINQCRKGNVKVHGANGDFQTAL